MNVPCSFRSLWQWGKLYFSFLLLLVIVLFSSCSNETIFQSNFDSTPLNSPPAHNQQVGTINIDGPSGAAIVVSSPINESGRWVQVIRQNGQQSVSGVQCNFSKFIGDGKYTFSSLLYIPSGSGLVTIQFETFGQSVGTYTNFLHIDFTQDNKVRIDDNDDTKFGSFQRDQSFMVQVSLDINATEPKVHIALGGTAASGEADYSIQPPLRMFAHQFGAVRLWMGFPWTGSFDANTIVVTHQLNN